MSDDEIVYGTAVYRESEPGLITVTEEGDEAGEPYRGPATGPPGIRDLHPTPWQNVPGQEWDQDRTGAWHVSVFRHEE
jgi:hypothetical protein